MIGEVYIQTYKNVLVGIAECHEVIKSSAVHLKLSILSDYSDGQLQLSTQVSTQMDLITQMDSFRWTASAEHSSEYSDGQLHMDSFTWTASAEYLSEYSDGQLQDRFS